EPVRADLGDVVDVAVTGAHLVHRHGQELLVAACLVAHAQRAARAAADHRPRDRRQRQDHQHVGRVAGAGGRAGEEAVVARIAHRRGQDAVDEDRPAFLVDLVLDRLGVLGDLDDDVDFFGDVAAGGDVVQAHGMRFLRRGGAASGPAAGGWGRVNGTFYAGRCCGAASTTSGTPQLGRLHTGAYTYGHVSTSEPAMTVQLDPQGNTAAQQSGVWSQPQADQNSLFKPAVAGPRAVAAVDHARADANGRRAQATETDGNASNTSTREQTRSSTGQPLFIDKLGNTAEVEITR